MKEHDLRPPAGSNRPRKRLGRGTATGQGKSGGRGTKGQNSRSGGGPRPYFEGGQLPLIRRLPFKRGFVNIFRMEYCIVNVQDLVGFPAGTKVTPELMAMAGLIKSPSDPVKVLGVGTLDRALEVYADSFSGSARTKIEAAGGSVLLFEAEQA
jgi:large subunit ribosomal protein L15